MNAEVGTDLYRRMLAFDYSDAERAELMAKVWKGTPWMLDVYIGDDERDRTIKEWCRDEFGPEALPIHGRPGDWQTGHATVFGWGWMGFATEELMQRFLARWPTPEGVEPRR